MKLKILVKLPNWVGDFIMCLPIAEGIRNTFPEAEITWLARPYLKGLAAYRSDLFNNFQPLEPHFEGSTAQLLAFGKKLRKRHFDKAFLFTGHFKGPLLARLAGIPRIYGPSQWYFSFLFSSTVLLPKRRIRDRHDQEYLVDFFGKQGVLNIGEKPRLRNIPHMESELKRAFLDGRPRPYLMVHAGSSGGEAKRWSPEHFASICRQFGHETGGTVFLLGNEDEMALNQHIQKRAQLGEAVVNLAGKTSLKEAIGLIGLCNLMISNDSGMMHVASAWSRPHITLFGPTDPQLVFPKTGPGTFFQLDMECIPCHKRQCPLGHHGCMRELLPENVWREGVAPMLARIQAH